MFAPLKAGAAPLLELVEPPPLLLDLPPLPQVATASAVATTAIAAGSALGILMGCLFSLLDCQMARHRSERGLSASCNPSPTKLNASTVSTSATPGNTMYHHALSKIGTADAIIWPQLEVGG